MSLQKLLLDLRLKTNIIEPVALATMHDRPTGIECAEIRAPEHILACQHQPENERNKRQADIDRQSAEREHTPHAHMSDRATCACQEHLRASVDLLAHAVCSPANPWCKGNVLGTTKNVGQQQASQQRVRQSGMAIPPSKVVAIQVTAASNRPRAFHCHSTAN